jgi:hypothetical protein
VYCLILTLTVSRFQPVSQQTMLNSILNILTITS